MPSRREERWKLLTQLLRAADDLARLETRSTNALLTEGERGQAREALRAGLREIARLATNAVVLVGDE